MRLSELLKSVEVLGVLGDEKVEVTGVAYDSRQVTPGCLFIAVPGEHVDGADFVSDAVSRGAVAIVSECSFDPGSGVALVQVTCARRALAGLANAFYGNLSKKLFTVGVTGTNGKTTTTYMIRDVLRAGGFEPGLLGTVAYEVGERSIPATRTTPEATEIHSMFERMCQHGCDAAVMEVSSHAIAMERVHGIEFNVAVFTNLTRDHLDFHGGMEAYFETKARFFDFVRDGGSGRTAVINIDDPWGKKLADERLLDSTIVTYGFDAAAQVRATKVIPSLSGTDFYVETPWGKGPVRLKLLGRFNVHNALAALATGGVSGVDFRPMVAALENLASVPGRLELVVDRHKRRIFVDYAHTDDALKNVLTTLREICKGRLIVVFGCGGNRDHGKREKMGRVACELADYSIITADNPRNEDPSTIAGHILEGFKSSCDCEVVLDRRAAIAAGIAMMKRKDVLLVAGKGHETYQEFKGAVVPFDDRETVREIAGI
ncbi:MAG: UDP-N-acetylmuramoyl-L-alanyl-D-glutamate--2,6-diaminopimelate ligase [Pontiellaceae bacterium]|nr:UDP-N-acetylmuramoyl-L-alanyl-D-glutamate--2,6-diaminopimelate ligase [Pontiellaceae bacterium]